MPPSRIQIPPSLVKCAVREDFSPPTAGREPNSLGFFWTQGHTRSFAGVSLKGRESEGVMESKMTLKCNVFSQTLSTDFIPPPTWLYKLVPSLLNPLSIYYSVRVVFLIKGDEAKPLQGKLIGLLSSSQWTELDWLKWGHRVKRTMASFYV